MSRKRHDNRQQRPSNLVRFIHPLWLDTRRGDGGRIVVRIWGRSGAAVELLADDRVMPRARIGRNGWVEVAPPGIRHGSRLSARGRRGHRSHLISA